MMRRFAVACAICGMVAWRNRDGWCDSCEGDVEDWWEASVEQMQQQRHKAK